MKKILLCLMTLLAVACADNDDDDTPAVPGGNGGGGQSGGNPPVAELIGSWTKPCHNAGSGVGHVRNSITVDVQNVSMLTQLYRTSTDCSGTSELETRSSLAYQVPNHQAGAVNQINMVVNSIRARLNTEEAVTTANLTSLCGITNWKLSEEREIAGLSCVTDLPAAGQPFYSLFQVQNANRLFIGKVDPVRDGSSPEKRPTELESEAYSR